MDGLSPMMEKYMETKSAHPDCILLYRLGDFYEMFFEDAKIASRELELTLTGKNCGLEERAPMCGVPFHAVDTYIDKLVQNGHKVAICEQVEDPKTAKGLVKREVTRIVTPGTNLIQDAENRSGAHNFLMGVVFVGGLFGISTVDVSTGDFLTTEVSSVSEATDEIIKFAPSEIICNASLIVSGIDMDDLKTRLGIFVSVLDDYAFDETLCLSAMKDHFKKDPGTIISDENQLARLAAGAVLKYLFETQMNSLSHITELQLYKVGRYMIIDSSTRRNLELTETMRDKSKKGSLFHVLDRTKTAMGARMLKSFIEQPLLSVSEINERLDAIVELNADLLMHSTLTEALDSVYDLERLMSKVSYKSINPRDMIALKTSLLKLPEIKTVVSAYKSSLWKSVDDEIDELTDISSLIESAIADDPPLQVKEGGIIKTGYNEEVDRLRLAKTDGKKWLSDLEEKAKNETGIKNLRIKYNRVFGYYFEVTNSFKDHVPANWIRKQTLANAERYTTEELKKIEEDILGAEERLFSLEFALFDDLREKIAAEILRIQRTARAVALADAVSSLAEVSRKNNYVRPVIKDNGVIKIKGGRHPVVESMPGAELFIDNDAYLDDRDNRIAVITGPNMAGKSTYMRQTALIVLMAQIGSFVPAESAEIGICDRIFTRVGASDDLASGRSTFMVEMSEVSYILKNATRKSLLILDEIGRGTSTYDGLSIAWAVVEYIADTKKLGSKALFATHYHELTELEGRLKGVKNYCIAVKEQGDGVIFLRKIIRGGADKSYGIQVARLAGLPEEVLHRAKEISDALLQNDINTDDIFKDSEKPVKAPKEEVFDGQLSLFYEPLPEKEPENEPKDRFDEKYMAVINEIKAQELHKMTPLDALNILYRLQEKLRK